MPAALPVHVHTSSPRADGPLTDGDGALLAVHGTNFHPAQGGATCTFSPLAEAEERTVLRRAPTCLPLPLTPTPTPNPNP